MIKITKKAKELIKTFTNRENKVYEYLQNGYVQAVKDAKDLNKADIADKQTRIRICENRIFNFAYTAQVLGLCFEFNPYGQEIEIDIN